MFFEAGTERRTRSQRGRLFQKAVILDVGCAGKLARLYYIETLPEFRGMGCANEALSWLCELADEFDMEFSLSIVPYEVSPDFADLHNWYRKYGFVLKDDCEMIRYPHATTN